MNRQRDTAIIPDEIITSNGLRIRQTPIPDDLGQTPNGNGKRNGNGNLTIREKRFAAIYDGAGDGVGAARLSGYQGNADALAATASRLIRKDKVMAVVQARNGQEEEIRAGIASRMDRQVFWSRVMWGLETQEVRVGKPPNDQVVSLPPIMKDRLKASELLGRSQLDFMDLNRGGDAPVATPAMTMEFLKNLPDESLRSIKMMFIQAEVRP
ncbi:hypothetical protein LCGC14_0845570 [marine sediment metagenome]|uniref:Uncharacterized protein n=1 Tax=marine sediment metagenome TaxID=412755 RepID=A0A0F9RWL7_9ZZZZ